MPSINANTNNTLTIRQGRIDLSFHQVVGEVFARVLRDERLFLDNEGHTLDVDLQVSSAPHPGAFAALQQNHTDLLVGWLDGSHGAYLAPFRDDVVIVGDAKSDVVRSPAVYSPYCVWAVPWYVPQAIVPDVTSLADGAVASRFAADEATGKRVLHGIGPGAGISRFSQEIVKEYGLDRQGWAFQAGTQETCFGNVEERVERGEWFVVPLWQPQYLHAKHVLRALHEPKSLLRPVDEARVVVSKAFLARLSDVQRDSLLQVLRRIRLGNAAVTAMDKYVHVDKLTYRDAARRWITEHAAQFDSWFTATGHADIVERAAEQSAYKLPKEPVNNQQQGRLAVPLKAPAAAGAYKAYTVSRTGLVHTSFQLTWELDHNLPAGAPPALAFVGPVASKPATGVVPETDALHAARICALNLLAQLRDAADGDLGRVQLLRLEGYVATTDDGVNVPRILDAASTLLTHALGPVQGAHARTALLLTSNPLNVPTMLGAVAELRW